MRWEGQRESENVQDRRGMGPTRVGGIGRIGLCGIILVLAIGYFTGTNPLTLLNMLNGVQEMTGRSADREPAPMGSPNDSLGKFASVVLADTETTWETVLPRLGRQYDYPRLVLFTGGVQSACGTTSSAVGPFYCPGDHKVYLDLSFFNVMSGWARPATSHRPMSSHMRLAIMFRISSVSPTKCIASSDRYLNQKAMPSLCGWNCRPIVLPASGAITQSITAA